MSKINYSNNYQQLKETKNSYYSVNELVYDDPFNEIETVESKEANKKLKNLINNGTSPIPTIGEIITGKVLYNRIGEGAGIDAGYKTSIEILAKGKDTSLLKNIEPNSNISVLITEIKESPFAIYGSISAAESIEKNEDMQEYILLQKPIIGTVIEYIGHGLYVKAELNNENINIFVPSALIGNIKPLEAKDLVDTEITLLLQSYNPTTGNFVGSRKHYLDSLALDAIEKLEKYPTIYTGTVTGVGKSSSGQCFGVFVQFNDILSCMIHKTNINPDFADKLDQIENGTQIDFYVKDIVDNRIMGTQLVKKSLWDSLKEGDVVTGRVKRVVTNGIFVSLDDETFGVISNNNDLSNLNTNFNSKVRVKISKIDRLKRNILLDLI